VKSLIGESAEYESEASLEVVKVEGQTNTDIQANDIKGKIERNNYQIHGAERLAETRELESVGWC
jgi:hypothetical protein